MNIMSKNMINKIIKLNIIFVVLFLLCCIINTSTAFDIYKSVTVPDTLNQLGGNIYWIAMAIGFAAGVIVIAIVGVKYIISSPEGKAEIKKQLVMYIIGAILVSSSTWVVGVIATAAYFK